jgi:hypothetical protein
MQITSFVIEGRMPVDIHMLNKILISLPGADPGFQVRGAHLKKLRLAEGGAKMFGVFRVKKITILRQKIIFFPIFFHFPLFSILRRNHEGTCLYRIQRKV